MKISLKPSDFEIVYEGPIEDDYYATAGAGAFDTSIMGCGSTHDVAAASLLKQIKLGSIEINGLEALLEKSRKKGKGWYFITLRANTR